MNFTKASLPQNRRLQPTPADAIIAAPAEAEALAARGRQVILVDRDNGAIPIGS